MLQWPQAHRYLFDPDHRLSREDEALIRQGMQRIAIRAGSPVKHLSAFPRTSEGGVGFYTQALDRLVGLPPLSPPIVSVPDEHGGTRQVRLEAPMDFVRHHAAWHELFHRLDTNPSALRRSASGANSTALSESFAEVGSYLLMMTMARPEDRARLHAAFEKLLAFREAETRTFGNGRDKHVALGQAMRDLEAKSLDTGYPTLAALLADTARVVDAVAPRIAGSAKPAEFRRDCARSPQHQRPAVHN